MAVTWNSFCFWGKSLLNWSASQFDPDIHVGPDCSAPLLDDDGHLTTSCYHHPVVRYSSLSMHLPVSTNFVFSAEGFVGMTLLVGFVIVPLDISNTFFPPSELIPSTWFSILQIHHAYSFWICVFWDTVNFWEHLKCTNNRCWGHSEVFAKKYTLRNTANLQFRNRFWLGEEKH